VQLKTVQSNNATQLGMAQQYGQTQISLANIDAQKAATAAAYAYQAQWNESSLRANVALVEYMTAAPGATWDPYKQVGMGY
jgi:hypothetical protein